MNTYIYNAKNHRLFSMNLIHTDFFFSMDIHRVIRRTSPPTGPLISHSLGAVAAVPCMIWAPYLVALCVLACGWWLISYHAMVVNGFRVGLGFEVSNCPMFPSMTSIFFVGVACSHQPEIHARAARYRVYFVW